MRRTWLFLFPLTATAATVTPSCDAGAKCTYADITQPIPVTCPSCFGIYGTSDTINSGQDLWAYSCVTADQAAERQCGEDYDTCVGTSSDPAVLQACEATRRQCGDSAAYIACDCTLDVCRRQINTTSSTTTSTTTTTTSSTTSSPSDDPTTTTSDEPTSTSPSARTTTSPQASTTTAPPKASTTTSPAPASTCGPDSSPAQNRRVKRDLISICRAQYSACVSSADQTQKACYDSVAHACESAVEDRYNQCLKKNSQKTCAAQIGPSFRTCVSAGQDQCDGAHAGQITVCQQRQIACLHSCDGS